jgi:hypothetical protein
MGALRGQGCREDAHVNLLAKPPIYLAFMRWNVLSQMGRTAHDHPHPPPNTVPLYGFNGRAQKIRLEFQSVAASVSKLPNESIEGVFLHKSRSQKTVAVSASLQTFVYELFTVQ